MTVSDRKFVLDVGSWFSNVATSVAIVFINKVLMQKSGYGFQFGTTLCGLHFLTSGLFMWASKALGLTQGGGKMPLPDLILFTVTANTSIVALNLSLMLNKVSFYQIAKLAIIPFCCLVEVFWLKRVFSRMALASIAVVMAGVGIVTVDDLSLEGNVLGVVIAVISIIASGLQQIFCRTLQQKHSLSSNELLAVTAPTQAWTLLLVGPFLDKLISKQWVFEFEYNIPALTCLAISCSLAVLVNLTQYLCLGRFSAVSFQVMGHAKTICVLLGSYVFLHDIIDKRQLVGMFLAVSGMVMYGSTQSGGGKKPAAQPVKPEQERLLVDKDSDGKQAAKA